MGTVHHHSWRSRVDRIAYLEGKRMDQGLLPVWAWLLVGGAVLSAIGTMLAMGAVKKRA
ncbi:MAG: hypothetical protein NVS2B17_34280 [Candidatus Velthaea sp.]